MNLLGNYNGLWQNDIFCLRERDLLNRFAAEVSQYQAQGESKESAFIVVRTLLNYKMQCWSPSIPPIQVLSVSGSLLITYIVFLQSYQVAEDLGIAFSDRAILQSAVEAENNVTDASLKVCGKLFFQCL